jgi:hypothetical protein
VKQFTVILRSATKVFGVPHMLSTFVAYRNFREVLHGCPHTNEHSIAEQVELERYSVGLVRETIGAQGYHVCKVCKPSASSDLQKGCK